MSQTRIYWKDEETKAVCDWIVENTAVLRGRSPISIVHSAENAVLPANRRRLKKCIAFYGRNGEGITKLLNEAYQRGMAIPATTNSAFPPESMDLTPQEREILAQRRRPEHVPTDPPELFREPPPEPPTEMMFQPVAPNLPTSTLVGELIVRLGGELMRSLSERLDRIESAVLAAVCERIAAPAMATVVKPTAPPVLPKPVEKPKPIKHVVSIVGLMRDQFGHVCDKTKELPFDLRWCDKEASHPMFPKTDYVIVQKHSPHRWFDAAQHAVTPSRVSFVDGGISGVVQRLYDLHARIVAEAGR